MATFKEALEYARQNPNSDFAKQFETGIKSGAFVEPARAEGFDLTPYVKAQTEQTVQQNIGIKQVVTEPFRTLVSQPGIRTGQAITSLGLKLANKLSGGKVSENIQARTGQTLDERLANFVGQDVTTSGGTVLSKGVDGSGRQIVGEALQSASYLIPYGKVVGALGGGTVGNVAAGALGGYLGDTGYGLTDENQAVGEALTPGVGTALGAALPLAAPLAQVGGRAISKTGSKMVESVIPVDMQEAGILQTYKANNPFFKRVADVLTGTEKAPITAGKTALTTKQGQTVNGLFGTKSQIGVQAKRASDSLWNDIISPRLKESTKAVDLDGFFAKVENDIIEKTPELSRQKDLLEAVQAIKEDYAGTKVVSLDKLQKLKEGWAQFVPDKAYRGKPIAGAFNDVRNMMSGEARQTIYNELGDDVKQAYLDYGNLIGLREMGQKSMTGQALKGGTGSLISEVLSQAVTPVGTVGGQVLYRIGNGLEFLGNAGAKKLSQVLGVADNVTQDANIPMKAQSKTTPKMIKNTDIPTVSKKNGIKSSNLSTSIQKPTGIKRVLNDAKETLKTLKDKNVRERGSISLESILPEQKSVGNQGVSLSNNNIKSSIAKAKASGQSFDEWVKGQGETVYHGTAKNNIGKIEKTGFKEGKAGDWGAGIYTTKDKMSADMYGDAFGGKTIEAVIPQNKIYEYKDFFLNKEKASKDIAKKIIGNNNVPETLKGMSVDDLAKRISNTFSTENPKFWLEKAGYAGIKDTDRIVSQIKDEIVIFDPSKIKTRSQLKAEWDKVAGKVDDLTTSIQKAKASGQSFDEWVKEQGVQIYHGSNEKIKVFSNKKGSQGVIWFTDNPKAITAGESGAQGTKFINERITIGKKFAGWDEYEKLGLGQIESMGFDGIKLPTKMQDGTSYNDYILFDNKTIKSPSRLKAEWDKIGSKADDLNTSIKSAKSSGQTFDEWVKGQSTELNYKNLQENDYSIKAYGKEFNEPVEYFRAGQVRKNGDIWLTDNEAGAMQYSSAGGGTKVGKYIVQSKNPLIIDTAGGRYAKGNIDINKILTKEEIAQGYTNNPDIKKKFIDYAKNNGYDAVQFADSFPDGEGGMRSLVVWNKDAIKTRSQLKAEWDKVK